MTIDSEMGKDQGLKDQIGVAWIHLVLFFQIILIIILQKLSNESKFFEITKIITKDTYVCIKH